MPQPQQSLYESVAVLDEEPEMGAALAADGHLELAAQERALGIAALKKIAARIAERSYPTGP